MAKNKSITVIGSLSSSPFIISDVNLLKKHCKVYTVDVFGNLKPSKFSRIFQYLSLGCNILFNAVPKIMMSDGVLIWFADVHAVIPILLSKLFYKKSVVAIGGFEVCNMPEINYGMMREPIGWRGKICQWVIKNADICIVPCQSYYDKSLPYVIDEKRLCIVPDCVETGVPLTMRNYNKRNLVLMVAQADESRYLLKGIPCYNEIAGKISSASFYLIGKYDETVKEKYHNIHYLGQLSHEEVFYWMNLSKVYCQLSATESFGVSILESMSMGCIPIATNVDNLIEIIDTNGIVVDRDCLNAANSVELALLKSSYELHKLISKNTIDKIKEMCETRENALIKVFEV